MRHIVPEVPVIGLRDQVPHVGRRLIRRGDRNISAARSNSRYRYVETALRRRDVRFKRPEGKATDFGDRRTVGPAEDEHQIARIGQPYLLVLIFGNTGSGPVVDHETVLHDDLLQQRLVGKLVVLESGPYRIIVSVLLVGRGNGEIRAVVVEGGKLHLENRRLGELLRTERPADRFGIHRTGTIQPHGKGHVLGSRRQPGERMVLLPLRGEVGERLLHAAVELLGLFHHALHHRSDTPAVVLVEGGFGDHIEIIQSLRIARHDLHVGRSGRNPGKRNHKGRFGRQHLLDAALVHLQHDRFGMHPRSGRNGNLRRRHRIRSLVHRRSHHESEIVAFPDRTPRLVGIDIPIVAVRFDGNGFRAAACLEDDRLRRPYGQSGKLLFRLIACAPSKQERRSQKKRRQKQILSGHHSH